MSRFINSIAALVLAPVLATASSLAFAEKFPNIGRPATEKEIAAWDIDVRPDFKGLPKGSGTVAKGQDVWEGKCASCHGIFGESNEVFTPIIGGTTQEDIKTGRVASHVNGRQPQKTTIMKVPTVSTLWDYINRAMPWTAPKSLTTEEVYSVVAYILNMAEIVPDDFTLSHENIAEVQKRMPNRNGMTTSHGMWDINGKPDVKSVACMKDCPVDEKIRSTLPDVSRNAHGNVAEQNRTFGATRGMDTTKPAPVGPLSAARAATASAVSSGAAAPAEHAGLSMAKKNACVACHGVANKIVGPGFNEIAARYKGNAAAAQDLLGKVKNGSSGTWGAVPMPPQAHVNEEEIRSIVSWILAGAK